MKIFSAMRTRMMNICAKFHWNPSAKYRDIVSQNHCSATPWTPYGL